MFQTHEILDTLRMIDQEKLDVRTITMGISLFNCVCDDEKKLAQRVYDRITKQAENLVKVGREIERDFGVPIVNKRVSVTPISLITGAVENPVVIARALELCRKELGHRVTVMTKPFSNGTGGRAIMNEVGTSVSRATPSSPQSRVTVVHSSSSSSTEGSVPYAAETEAIPARISEELPLMLTDLIEPDPFN